MHFRSYICRCMHFRSYVTQMCALHALSCADVCTSDPISRRCVHFRTYRMQMCALPILYDADVCTSVPDSCSCVHFSAANGLQLGASVLLADVLLLVPPLRLRHPLLVFGRMLRLLRRSTMPSPSSVPSASPPAPRGLETRGSVPPQLEDPCASARCAPRPRSGRRRRTPTRVVGSQRSLV